jgi:hypothetical protein
MANDPKAIRITLHTLQMDISLRCSLSPLQSWHRTQATRIFNCAWREILLNNRRITAKEGLEFHLTA